MFKRKELKFNEKSDEVQEHYFFRHVIWESGNGKKTLSSLDELEGDKRDLQFRATEKMVLGLANQAKKQVGRLFGENISRLPELTDFINRFEVSGEELPYIDFNFINEEK